MWYAYSMEPIDWGWENLISVPDYLKTLAVEEANAKLTKCPSESESVDAFLAAYAEARVAVGAEWEGTVRGNVYVFFLPFPATGGFVYGFTWKQDTNGVTFVVSPCRLPWLEDRDYGEYRTE